MTNNNHESLWGIKKSKCSLRKSLNTISSEYFSKILCKLLIRFQHLKFLSLSGLPKVTDYITSQSQSFGSKIRFLCLQRFSGYSDKKLSMIFSSFPGLALVRLSYSHITDKGLEVLTKSCASLENVDLRNCQKITDKGLEVLEKSCASLETVDLRNCQKITDKGLEVPAKSCASLERVDLTDCQQIIDKGLEVLAKCCASLVIVELKNC
ncbi:hypothetical protein MKW98_020742 [Papaver atlanticum]|uniref:F-box/LRR-repeat protein 15-like leucin rich repeat domain-containing protein n=1 Tax=Papaver atlanticum TaxID=357466 RepID=A0AAD4XWW0_9MAGN|nr:hypothetical protein MKW98_020742 [Papaver atlanticum]